jgi:hypothetical protein
MPYHKLGDDLAKADDALDTAFWGEEVDPVDVVALQQLQHRGQRVPGGARVQRSREVKGLGDGPRQALNAEGVAQQTAHVVSTKIAQHHPLVVHNRYRRDVLQQPP